LLVPAASQNKLPSEKNVFSFSRACIYCGHATRQNSRMSQQQQQQHKRTLAAAIQSSKRQKILVAEEEEEEDDDDAKAECKPQPLPTCIAIQLDVLSKYCDRASCGICHEASVWKTEVKCPSCRFIFCIACFGTMLLRQRRDMRPGLHDPRALHRDLLSERFDADVASMQTSLTIACPGCKRRHRGSDWLLGPCDQELIEAALLDGLRQLIASEHARSSDQVAFVRCVTSELRDRGYELSMEETDLIGRKYPDISVQVICATCDMPVRGRAAHYFVEHMTLSCPGSCSTEPCHVAIIPTQAHRQGIMALFGPSGHCRKDIKEFIAIAFGMLFAHMNSGQCKSKVHYTRSLSLTPVERIASPTRSAFSTTDGKFELDLGDIMDDMVSRIKAQAIFWRLSLKDYLSVFALMTELDKLCLGIFQESPERSVDALILGGEERTYVTSLFRKSAIMERHFPFAAKAAEVAAAVAEAEEEADAAAEAAATAADAAEAKATEYAAAEATDVVEAVPMAGDVSTATVGTGDAAASDVEEEDMG
jgi:hypothetical protein